MQQQDAWNRSERNGMQPAENRTVRRWLNWTRDPHAHLHLRPGPAIETERELSAPTRHGRMAWRALLLPCQQRQTVHPIRAPPIIRSRTYSYIHGGQTDRQCRARAPPPVRRNRRRCRQNPIRSKSSCLPSCNGPCLAWLATSTWPASSYTQFNDPFLTKYNI
jgi:hypothetical protein